MEAAGRGMPKLEHALYGSLAGLAAFVAYDHVTRRRRVAPALPQRNAAPRLRPARPLPSPPAAPECVSLVTLPDLPGTVIELDDEPEPEPERTAAHASLEELLEHYFDAEETPGRFYTIQPGDTPETIARAVLSKLVERPTRQQILDYIHVFSSCSYNLDRYGSRSTSLSFPAKWCVPGLGLGLRAAFLPRNADAIDQMAAGLPVPRTVDDQGRPLDPEASSHGTVWLCPVDPERLRDEGVVTCEGFAYECGTSQLEPDPMLLHRLEAA